MKQKHHLLKIIVFLTLYLSLAACTTVPIDTFTPVDEVSASSTEIQADLPADSIETTMPEASPTEMSPTAATEPDAIEVSSPTPDLTTCSDEPLLAQPQQILYTNGNRVWLWNEIDGTKTEVPLPADVVAPRISDDGRFVAFVKEGQAYDSPTERLAAIPLWLFDRQAGQERQLASLATLETPSSADWLFTQLKLQWLPGSHWLIAQVSPEITGVRVPMEMGDLYLIDAEEGNTIKILADGNYEWFSVRPDGGQIAALDLTEVSEGGLWNDMVESDDALVIIDVPPAAAPLSLPVRLPQNPWDISSPIYAPDGTHLALGVEDGLLIVDTSSGAMTPILASQSGLRKFTWLPDGKSFYTWVSPHNSTESKTSLSLVEIESAQINEEFMTLPAYPCYTHASPDHRLFAYLSNDFSGLWLMSADENEPRLYDTINSLDMLVFSPNSPYFLYDAYDYAAATVGSTCRPPQTLALPDGTQVERFQWLDAFRFLAWTKPSEDLPCSNTFTINLLQYSLPGDLPPVQIDEIVLSVPCGLQPYEFSSQAVVLGP